ncbi:MAG: hypothetical protein JOZ60_07495 [Verrucomicrobia bacterium]|nr:hypothetical protein [Verrucomicrobiota bacterium]
MSITVIVENARVATVMNLRSELNENIFPVMYGECPSTLRDTRLARKP